MNGSFNKSAKYKMQLEELLGTLVEDANAEEPQRFDVKIKEDFVGKSKRAALTKTVRSLHLIYRDPCTDKVQVALVVVDPDEPLSKVIEMSSTLEPMCKPEARLGRLRHGVGAPGETKMDRGSLNFFSASNKDDNKDDDDMMLDSGSGFTARDLDGWWCSLGMFGLMPLGMFGRHKYKSDNHYHQCFFSWYYCIPSSVHWVKSGDDVWHERRWCGR